jgi:hypothetical protein
MQLWCFGVVSLRGVDATKGTFGTPETRRGPGNQEWPLGVEAEFLGGGVGIIQERI